MILTLTKELYSVFSQYIDDLPFLFIVSQVELKQREQADIKIKVVSAEGSKCSRCWNFRVDVGGNKEHPGICLRCVEAIERNY